MGTSYEITVVISFTRPVGSSSWTMKLAQHMDNQRKDSLWSWGDILAILFNVKFPTSVPHSKSPFEMQLNDESILCVTDNFLFASACVIFLLGKFLGKPNIVSNQPSCRMSMKCCDGNSLRGSSDKIGTILC